MAEHECVLRIFPSDMEGRAPSWPHLARAIGCHRWNTTRTRPQRVPAFGCGRRPV